MTRDFRQSYGKEHQRRNKAESHQSIFPTTKSGMINVHSVYVDVLAEIHLLNFQV